MVALSLLISVLVIVKFVWPSETSSIKPSAAFGATSNYEWKAPSLADLPNDSSGNLVRYGHELIANTAKYLGPKGTIASISNGMNCQNCHIQAGLKPNGNCFSGVAAIYPTFRPRSGIVESIEFRINDCLKRSLNGSVISDSGREMRAMVAYLEWLGAGVPEGTKPKGAGAPELKLLGRAADPKRGALLYQVNCERCHGRNGGGARNNDSSGFVYPPLWGPESYNTGAGLYRLTRFASYVRYNMPFDKVTGDSLFLTDEEAWDLAAFVNSQERPHKDFSEDWPDLTKKAIDHPFGPYADSFPESQHKFGPFGPIKEYYAKLAAKK